MWQNKLNLVIICQCLLLFFQINSKTVWSSIRHHWLLEVFFNHLIILLNHFEVKFSHFVKPSFFNNFVKLFRALLHGSSCDSTHWLQEIIRFYWCLFCELYLDFYPVRRMLKLKISDVLIGSFSFENRAPTDTERDLMQQMEVENTR